MVFLRRIEMHKRPRLHGKRLSVFFFLAPDGLADRGGERLVVVPDPGAVLSADVAALPVDAERVDRQEVELQQARGRQPLFVEHDPHGLRVVGPRAADLLVGRVRRLAVGVADRGFRHAVELIEKLLRSPEAAAGQVDRFHS